MKSVLLISSLLTIALATHPANALTSENISITETGGMTVSGDASASGSDDASAEVHSFIQSGGDNTRVRVEINTAADGQAYATSVERVIGEGTRMDVRAGVPSKNVDVEVEGEAKAEGEANMEVEAGEVSNFLLFDRLGSFLEKVFSFVFFFW